MKNWMEKDLGRRLLAMVLCLSMVLSMAPLPAFAEGCTHHPEHTPECGYVAEVTYQPCTHQHDAACGYQEGAPCTHSCADGTCGYREFVPCNHSCGDGNCGFAPAVECDHVHGEQCGENGESCPHTCGDGTCAYSAGAPCNHSHNEACGYQEAQGCGHSHNETCGYREARDCGHQHDESCGYREAVAGSPCTFDCEICNATQEPATPTCTCETKCSEGNATDSCQVCIANIGDCTGKEQETPETCAHGNDPATCEVCASIARVAAVQAQIDALPEDVTAETKDTVQSFLTAVDAAKAALSETEQAQLDMTRYTALAEKLAALDKCAHNSDPLTCEACASEARVASVQALIDALPAVEELTAETEAQAREQLAIVKAAVEALAAEEQAQLKLDKYTALSEYFEALDEAAKEPTEAEPIVITEWQWDYDEYIHEESGCMVLPITSEEFASYLSDEETYEVILSMLPGAILVGEDELTLGEWTYEAAPEGTAPVEIEGVSCQPEGFFKTTLPEGYVLADESTVLSLTVVLIPAENEEDTPVTYEAETTATNILYRTCDSNGTNWRDETCASAIIVTTGDTTWGDDGNDGWYVVQGNVTIGDASSIKRITVSGNVNLILTNKSSLTVNGGIQVKTGNSLTIYAQSTVETEMGTLTVQNVESQKAGIGTDYSTDAGTVTINGGKVTATGGQHAAGIGGAYYNNIGSSGGTITINGSKVTATGGDYAAGIGGGESGSGGNITINGGDVNATGGTCGAGIGGGQSKDGGSITINGGTVRAEGKDAGAGIGGGSYGKGGTIRITGGKITAIGSSSSSSGGAGIGGGESGSGGNITITGGEITATGGDYAAGIGGGSSGQCGIILIEGGTITATAGVSAAGIGCGNNKAGGTVTITGGTVTATGGAASAENLKDGGPGIGVDNNNSDLVVTISGGIVTATGKDGGKGIDVRYARFSTGENGSAVIFASSIESSSDTTSWSGVIFQGESGLVYGNQTLSAVLTIEAGKTLTIPENTTLTISDGATLYNQGTIYNNGTITGKVTGNQPEGKVPAAYKDETGADKEETCNVLTSNYLAANNYKLGEGWYVVIGEFSVGTAESIQRLIVDGDVKLILADGCDFTVSGGIGVKEGNSLTIYAHSTDETTMGKLTVQNVANYYAGIGGSSSSGGTITINGGKVTATGGEKAAGIGGGNGHAGGTITINGGTVTAKGGNGGAGIGGGYCGYTGGTIEITGGTVNATGGRNGAGIGGGEDGSGGSVIITGGTVNAAGVYGAGIGGGKYGGGGSVTITGGTVNATGDDLGAGIGGWNSTGGTFSTGENGSAVLFASSIGDQTGKDSWSGVIFQGSEGQVYGTSVTPVRNFEVPGGKKLVIPLSSTLTVAQNVTLTNNGTIQVLGTLTNNGTIQNNGVIFGTGTIPQNITGNQPAAIAADYRDADGEMKTAVCDGEVTAESLTKANNTLSGGWYVVQGEVTIGTAEATQRVTISGDVHLILADGCKFTVNGGIGVSANNSLTIYGQSAGTGELNVTGVADNNAGIGGNGNESCGTITIHGGKVTAKGGIDGAGIGGSGGTITITDGSVTATGGTNGAGIGGGNDSSGGTITINGGTVEATGGENGAGIGGGLGGSGGFISINSDSVTATCGTSARYNIGGGLNGDSGIVFNNSDIATISGSQSMPISFTIDTGRTLVIDAGTKLTIPEGVTATNNGTITINNKGTIDVQGELVNNGTINNAGAITGTITGNQPKIVVSNIKYMDWNGTALAEKTCNIAAVVTGSVNSWGKAGETTWYVVQASETPLTIDSWLTVNGDVHLILADGCHLTVNNGIEVNAGTSLTIYAQSTGSEMGQLTATCTVYGAGIGGGTNSSGGIITINGGEIKATGSNGAGIGGGYTINPSGSVSGGKITINGGTVTATSDSAAGIGGGGSIYNPGGNGTFSTGENGHAVIFASSISDKNNQGSWSGIIFEGNNGAVYGDQTLNKNLTIEEGKNLTIPTGVTLTIPNGVTLTNYGTIINNGTITGTITGKQPPVTVTYKDPANTNGVDPTAYCTVITADYLANQDPKYTLSGGWYVVQDEVIIGTESSKQRITVNGNVSLILADDCKFTVNGGIEVGSGNSLTIYGQTNGTGTLTATGSYCAAGIGGGFSITNGNDGGTVTINGGTVTATGGMYAAGIGGGAGGIDAGKYTGGSGATVTINGGTVIANSTEINGFQAPGIGGGMGNTKGGAGGSLTVNGGYVVASGIGGAASKTGNTPGASGTFSVSGNSVVVSDYIKDKTNEANWSGIIIENSYGQVYGSHVTPTGSFEIPEGSNLLIPAGTSLTIPTGITVTNKGSVYVNGNVEGGFTGTGGVYYPLTLTNCTAEGAVVTYPADSGTRYGKADGKITLTGTGIPAGKAVSSWTFDDSTIKVTGGSSFTMPSNTVAVTAAFGDILASVTTSDGDTTNYANFQYAFDAANGAADSTLKLLANVSDVPALTVTGKFTLDLNGQTLTSNAAGPAITVNKYGSLTITDGSDGNPGAIEASGTYSVQIQSKGTLNFNAGSLKKTVNNEWGGTLKISGTATVDVTNNEKAVKNEGTLEISGGTLTGRECVYHSNGTTRITGGSFTPKYCDDINSSYCIYFGVADATGSTLTIQGGTFDRGSGDQKMETFFIRHEAYSSGLKVSGGTFNGGVSVKNGFTGLVTPLELLTEQKAYFTQGDDPQLLDGSSEITVDATVGAHPEHTFSCTKKDDNWHTATCGCGHSEDQNHVFVEGDVDYNGFCKLCDAYQPITPNEESVYEITNAGQLYWFGDYVNKTNRSASAKLMENIDASYTEEGKTYHRSWSPIGSSICTYEGTFDGNGKTVSGLEIKRGSDGYIGFFGTVVSGWIKNLTIEDCTVSESGVRTGDTIAVLCGWLGGGTIEGCTNQVSLYFGDPYYQDITLAGICGYMASGTIKGCTNSRDISISGSGANNTTVGGICGENSGSGEIKNCTNSGNISGTDQSEVGGICGKNDGGIQFCTNSGNISGAQAGGICGNDQAGVIGCANSGTIEGYEYAGGICGYSSYGPNRCYNIGNVSSEVSSNVGPICGAVSSGYHPDYCYYQGSDDDDMDGTTAMTEEQFNRGEVTWLLNQDLQKYESITWYQTLEEPNRQLYPSLSGGIVYHHEATCPEYDNVEMDSDKAHTPKLDSSDRHVCEICGAALVASLRTTAWEEYGYRTIEQAFDAANVAKGNDVTLTLREDVTAKNNLIVYGNFTLNLGNCTLSMGIHENREDICAITIFNGGKLTVTCGDGDIRSTIKGEGENLLEVRHGGELVIKGGIIHNRYDHPDFSAVRIYAGGEAIISGGQLKGWNCVLNEGKLVISGGQLQGQNCVLNEGELEISGATLKSTGGVCVSNSGTGTVTISKNSENFDISKTVLESSGCVFNTDQGITVNATTVFPNGVTFLEENRYPRNILGDRVAYYYYFGENVWEDRLVYTPDNYTSISECCVVRSHNEHSFRYEYVDGPRGTQHNAICDCGYMVLQFHRFNDINGFCEQCDAYQPITPNEDVYEITNAGQLFWFADYVNSGNEAAYACGSLKDNITIPEKADRFKRAWTPIGTDMNPYEGSFSGDGHSISGLYFAGDVEYGSLFGMMGQSGSIRSLTVEDIEYDPDASFNVRAGICGYNNGGEIADCTNAAQIGCNSDFNEPAGICHTNNGTISGCVNNGNVSGWQSANAGGICVVNNGTIKECANTGEVHGAIVGGICALNGYEKSGAKIQNCANRGALWGINVAGGICADNYGTVSDCYHFVSITYEARDSGPIVGYSNEGSSCSNCYYLADRETDALDGTTYKTRKRFASGEVAYLLNGGRTEGTTDNPVVWRQTIGERSYPTFYGEIVYHHESSCPEYDNVQTDSGQGHTLGQNNTCSTCGAELEASVTVDGTVTCYVSLRDAFAAANGKTATIQLLRDVIIGSEELTISSGNVTLRAEKPDGAGEETAVYTITHNSSGVAIYVSGNGTFNFESGTLHFPQYSQQIGIQVNGGTLNFQGGTITECDGTDSIGMNGGTVNISGGTVGRVYASTGNLNISKGTVDTLYVAGAKTALSGGSFGKIQRVTGGDVVSALLAEGYAYKLSDGTWVDATNGNDGMSLEGTIQVLPVPVRITTQPEDTSFTCGDTSKSLSVQAAGAEGKTVSYQWYQNSTKMEGETDSTLSLDGLGAGSYQFYCHLTCDGYVLNSNTVTVTVNKAVVEIPTITSKVYDGSVQTAEVPASERYTVKLNAGGTNAGSYDVVLELTDSTNYKWSDGTQTAQKTIQFHITQATTNSWTTTPAISGWTYGGTASTPVGAAKFGTVTVTFMSRDGQTHYSNAPTEAGEYTAVFSVAQTANYVGVRDTSVNFTISPKPITVTITPGGGTYGGTFNDATATISEGQLVGEDQVDVTLTYTGTANDGTVVNGTTAPTHAGSYTVTATISNPNYSLAKTTAQFVVAKATVTTPTVDSKPYSGSVQTADVSNTDLYTVAVNNGGVEVKTEGYPVEFTLKDSSNYQWDDQGGKTTFRITKAADNSWTAGPAITGWTYGEAAKAPTCQAKFGTVKVEYSADGTTYSETVPTNAGSYKARFTVAETGNYAGIGPVDKDFTISPKNITVTITPNGGTYGNVTAATAKINETLVGNDQVDVTLTYTGTANDGTTYSDTKAPSKAGSYTVNATISDSNYKLTGNTTEQFVVAKATVTTPTVASKPYSGSVQTADVSNTDLYTVAVNDGGVEVKTEGYPVEFALKDSSNYQWDDQDGKTTFQITQADNEWTKQPDITGWTYGGTASTPVGAAKFGTVTVTFMSRDGQTHYSNAPTAAGEYTAVFSVAQTANYVGVQDTSVNFTISPKPITVTITPGGGTYGGTYNDATAVANELVGDDQVDVTLTYTGTANDGTVASGTTAPTHAGTYTVSASISDSNYKLTGETTAEFKVEKATVTTPSVESKAYTGSKLTADVALTEDSLYTLAVNKGGEEVITEGYPVEFKLKDSNNYQWDDQGGRTTFQITQADNSWSTDPAITGWTYGDTANAPTSGAKFGTVTVEYKASDAEDDSYSETVPTNAGNYTARFTVAATHNYKGLSEVKPFSIEKRPLTLTWDETTTFTYDGDTHQPTAQAGNVVNGERITLVVSGEQKTVGDAYTATVTGFTAEDNSTKESNYCLPEQNLTTSFSITPKNLTVNSATVTARAYNGSNVVDISAINLDGVVTGEAVSVSTTGVTGTLDGPNAGTYTQVTLNGTLTLEGKGAGNYTLTQPTKAVSCDVTISPKELTIVGITAESKIYNGNKSANISTSFEGVVDSDVLYVVIIAKGDFGDANVGNGKTVTTTGFTLEGSASGNYKLPDNQPMLTTTANITPKELTVTNVKVADKQYDGLNTAALTGTPTLVGVVGNDDVTLVNGTPTFKTVDVGNDIDIVFTTGFTLNGAAKGNYTLTQPTGITASIFNHYTAEADVDFTTNSASANSQGWMNQALEIEAKDGFTLSLTNTAEEENWGSKLTVDQNGTGTLTFYVRNATGAISNPVKVSYKIDKTAPTGTIWYGERDETEASPMALYKNQDVAVTIKDSDDRSGVASVGYLVSSEKLEENALKASDAWTEGRSFTIKAEDGATKYVYAKVVDNADNTAYFRANYIVFDTTAPSVTGVDNGATYRTTQTVTVADTNPASLTLNGTAAASPITLEGNKDAIYTIVATDKAGNITTVTVTMKTLDSLTEDVEKVDNTTVTKGDKENLEKAKKDLEDQLASATEAEKQEISDLLKPIDEALAALAKVEAVEQQIQALPESIQIDDEDPTDENAIKAARAAYEKLTDHEKTLADIEKLTKLESDLVAYKIISGDGSVWNMGSGEDLRFTANGPVRKLKQVELDGEKLEEANYQVEKGSTIVTLDAAFMQSLEEGSHTLRVVYTDGQTEESTFEVKRSESYLDLTEEPAFQGRTEVFVDGVSYPIEVNGDSYVNLPETGDLLTLYTYRTGAGDYGDYPTGMEVYRINRSADGTTVTHIPALSNLLQYSGCSIRVTGNRGIRMITSLDQDKKTALTTSGLAGFTLEEYGTVVTWASDLGEGDLNLNSGKHNFAYKRGVADPVFGTSGNLTQYTNVLVGFSLEECSKDIVMRPYIVLRAADGNQYTLYGGCVTRSISYIAWQNRDTYKPWTSAYDYVRELMGLYNAA